VHLYYFLCWIFLFVTMFYFNDNILDLWHQLHFELGVKRIKNRFCYWVSVELYVEFLCFELYKTFISLSNWRTSVLWHIFNNNWSVFPFVKSCWFFICSIYRISVFWFLKITQKLRSQRKIVEMTKTIPQDKKNIEYLNNLWLNKFENIINNFCNRYNYNYGYILI